MYTRNITTKLKNLIVFTKDVPKSLGFFNEALGLKVVNQSQIFAELVDAGNQKIFLKKATCEAYCTAGYSPILNFEIENLDVIIEKAKSYGATLDGDQIQTDNKKIACIKVPDGPMIGLIQYLQPSDSEEEGIENPIKEEDKNMKEIRNILKKIKLQT